MNAYQFAQAEAQRRERQLARFEHQQDADESRAEAIEARAAELWNKLAVQPDGSTCPNALDEALGDLCIRPEIIQRLAKCRDNSQPEQAGQILLEWFDTYWERRCRELAEEQIDAEEEHAREEFESDRAADADFDRRYP